MENVACLYLLLSQRALHQKGHARIHLQTTREGLLPISSDPENPLCHNKAASLLKWRGGARFPQVATMKSWQMEAAAVPR